MKLSFRILAPAAEPWLRSLSQSPFIRQVNEAAWVFAAIETLHLLSLAVLGGAVLALALRLLGLVLTEVSAAEVERRTRPWLHAGVIGALGTGVLMGIINSGALYPSAAFFVKMVALAAAILFSYAVARRVVREGEAPSPAARAVTAAATLIWALALFLFVATPRVNPGMVLVVGAGVALLAAAARGRRRLLLGGLAAIVLAGWLVTHVLMGRGADAHALAWANMGFVAAAFLFAVAVGALEIRREGPASGRAAKLAGFALALSWITVAAAGRWIGFS